MNRSSPGKGKGAAMVIGFLTFGVMCGATAAFLAATAGAGLLVALAAYAVVGSVGLLAMAMPNLPQA